MRVIIALENQTLWDLALQAMGDVAGVFDILALNPFLRLDMAIPAGTEVLVPDQVINTQVFDYYSRNDIHPVSGLGEEVVLTDDSLIYMKKTLNYSLSGGNATFDGVRLWNLYEKITIQVNYSSVTSDSVRVFLEQSLDGLQYGIIRDADSTLDPTKVSHTFNVLGLCSNYVRLRVECAAQTVGILNEIIFRV